MMFAWFKAASHRFLNILKEGIYLLKAVLQCSLAALLKCKQPSATVETGKEKRAGGYEPVPVTGAMTIST